MRKWAYLKQPESNGDESIYKIMAHETENGTYIYLFLTKTGIFCTNDEWYETLSDAMEYWDSRVDEEGWHFIDDPLPNCQHDSIEPIRVKGRAQGKPEWGKYEILRNGVWVEYNSDDN